MTLYRLKSEKNLDSMQLKYFKGSIIICQLTIHQIDFAKLILKQSTKHSHHTD